MVGPRDVLQPYRSQWEFFLDALASGRGLRAVLEESVAGVEVIEALYEAAAGRPATLGGAA